jgi:aminopeptidase N
MGFSRASCLAPALALFALATLGCSSSDPVRTDPSDAGPDAPAEASAPDPIAALTAAAAPYLDVNARGYDAESYRLATTIATLAEARPLTAKLAMTLTIGRAGLPVVVLDSEVARIASVEAGGRPLTFAQHPERPLLLIDTQPLALTEGAKLELVIDYEIGAGGVFLRGAAKTGACTENVLFTQSEPRLGRFWLPAHHVPNDRATFAVDLRFPAGRDAIGNGARVTDETAGDVRHVQYASDHPLPTYVMAFAIGQLDHVEQTKDGEPPVSIWYRACHKPETPWLLEQVRWEMDLLEQRLGKFPFAAYATVLLPELTDTNSSGMENAGITFADETESYNAKLLGHELAHQWLGDYVTIEGYADAWIKEGMASLLGAEIYMKAAAKPPTWEPLDRAGDLMQPPEWHAVYTGPIDESAVDLKTGLHVGVFRIAGSVWSQLRSIVGETAFWSTWRDLLAKNAWGTFTTAKVLEAFDVHLDDARRLALRRALAAATKPTLTVENQGDALAIGLKDPDGFVFAPFVVTNVAADGQATDAPLATGAPIRVIPAAGGYVAPDESGVFMRFDVEGKSSRCTELLTPYLRPTSAPALARFDQGPAAARRYALQCAPP